MPAKRHYLVVGSLLLLLFTTVFTVLPQDTTPVPAQPHILVWQEAGPTPAQSSPSAAGELGLMSGSGEFESFLEVPAQTSRVRPCGDEATSPDGTRFAFYIGLDTGTLYLMTGAGEPAAVDDVDALTCVGGGTFQYSPDSSQMAYVAYESDASASEFADGFLHVVQTGDLTETFLYENVTAFDITNDGVGFVSFFTNNRNEADEAAVLWWNGSTERELATLRPDENCRYTSASVAATPDNNLMIVLGHRCTSGDTRTSWQLYMVDAATRSATLAASEFQTGQFASFARTNQVIVLPDGDMALFAVPDGITANTIGLRLVNMADLSTSVLVEQQVVFPTLNQGSNAFPLISPDGRWLAVVVTTPNNDNTLNVYDLNDPSAAPITVSAGSRNDIISDMIFSPDSQRLVFIAGSESTGRTADNSLIALDLNSGSDFRVKRGRFARGLAMAPDGSAVAVMDAQVLEDERQPPFLNLFAINIDTSETTLLYEGADVVDGEVTNQRFAKPLSWR
jgi:WD40 repeat protein